MRVIAPGSIPRASGDRVKTDRRDAKRLVRLFAAGELSFALVPSEEDERFRDLVRCTHRGCAQGSDALAPSPVEVPAAPRVALRGALVEAAARALAAQPRLRGRALSCHVHRLLLRSGCAQATTPGTVAVLHDWRT